MKKKKVIAGIMSMSMVMSMGLSSVSTFAASRTMNGATRFLVKN